MGETNEEQEEFVMDPKAGGVDVYIPPLKPDCRAVSLALMTVGRIRGISKYNKDVLFKYAKMFDDLAEGKHTPYSSTKRGVKRKMNTNLHQPSKRHKRKHRKFKRSLPKTPKPVIKKRFKNLNKAQIRIKSELSDVGDQLWTSIEMNAQETLKPKLNNVGGSDKIKASPDFKRDNRSDVLKSPLKTTTLEKGRTVLSQGGWEIKKIISKSTESNKVIKGRKRKPKTIGPSKSPKGKVPKIAFEEKPLMQVQPKPKQRKKIGALKSDSSHTIKSPSGLITGNKGKNYVKKDNLILAGKKFISGSSHDVGIDKSKEASLVREKNTLSSQNDRRLPSPSENKTAPMVNVGRKKSRRRKKKNVNKSAPLANGQEKSGGKVDPWDEPLKEGETEIVIRSKKFAKKLKQSSKHRHLVIKNPKVNTKGRTLKINLRRNEEHDMKDYNKVLKSSPGIPYSAHKKPLSSVLKSCK